jgi:hypothetical protein
MLFCQIELLFRVLQLPLSFADIGLVLNHWQVAHRIGKEKLAPPALTRLRREQSARQAMFSRRRMARAGWGVIG